MLLVTGSGRPSGGVAPRGLESGWPQGHQSRKVASYSRSRQTHVDSAAVGGMGFLQRRAAQAAVLSQRATCRPVLSAAGACGSGGQGSWVRGQASLRLRPPAGRPSAILPLPRPECPEHCPGPLVCWGSQHGPLGTGRSPKGWAGGEGRAVSGSRASLLEPRESRGQPVPLPAASACKALWNWTDSPRLRTPGRRGRLNRWITAIPVPGGVCWGRPRPGQLPRVGQACPDLAWGPSDHGRPVRFLRPGREWGQHECVPGGPCPVHSA